MRVDYGVENFVFSDCISLCKHKHDAAVEIFEPMQGTTVMDINI